MSKISKDNAPNNTFAKSLNSWRTMDLLTRLRANEHPSALQKSMLNETMRQKIADENLIDLETSRLQRQILALAAQRR
jgi:hypothetical protein